MFQDSCASTVPRPQDKTDPKRLQFPEQIINFGVSTSALFDTREDDRVFREQGEAAYMRRMREMVNEPFTPGPILPFIKKMLAINTPDNLLINLTILSRNNPQVAERVHKSLYAHGLSMEKGAFRFGVGEAYMKGRAITPALLLYFGVNLFMSSNEKDVINALREGIAAGQSFHGTLTRRPSTGENILVAFDFDRVMGIGKGKPGGRFKQDSEAFFRKEGLKAYWKREARLATHPAEPGPLASFYLKLAHLRDYLHEIKSPRKLELAIVTARTSDALTRVLTTIEYWGGESLEPDFLISSGHAPKAGHLAELQADIFFDDSKHHVEGAVNTTASIHVPYVEAARPKGRDNRRGMTINNTL